MSLTYPELELDEIAEACECSVEFVRASLAHRLAIHEVRPYRGDTGRTSDAELLAALGEWGAQTDHHTGDDYNRWAEQAGVPGRQTVQNRFGSWNTALTLAGLGAVVQQRGLRPHLGDDALWATLYEFYATTDLPSYAAQAYDAWARPLGRASQATLRNRLGTWTEMKTRTRELMRYAATGDGDWAWAEQVLAIVPGEVERNIITREKCLTTLQLVADRCEGPLTVQLYEAHREPKEPTSAAIQTRCGSWVTALVDAGLSDRMSAKARGRWRQSDQQNSASDQREYAANADTSSTAMPTA